MGKMAMKDAESQNVEYKRSWHDNGDTQGDTQGLDLDTWIENEIASNPKITTEELAQKSKKGIRTIKRHLAKLKHINYVGSGYSGHWEIIQK